MPHIRGRDSVTTHVQSLLGNTRVHVAQCCPLPHIFYAVVTQAETRVSALLHLTTRTRICLLIMHSLRPSISYTGKSPYRMSMSGNNSGINAERSMRRSQTEARWSGSVVRARVCVGYKQRQGGAAQAGCVRDGGKEELMYVHDNGDRQSGMHACVHTYAHAPTHVYWHRHVYTVLPQMKAMRNINKSYSVTLTWELFNDVLFSPAVCFNPLEVHMRTFLFSDRQG
eukprot:565859-Pelagomonas_calceolata.AAC.2